MHHFCKVVQHVTAQVVSNCVIKIILVFSDEDLLNAGRFLIVSHSIILFIYVQVQALDYVFTRKRNVE